MSTTATRTHPVFAVAYDPMTRALERAVMAERRARLLADLDGQVLDVGAGTGASLDAVMDKLAAGWSQR